MEEYENGKGKGQEGRIEGEGRKRRRIGLVEKKYGERDVKEREEKRNQESVWRREVGGGKGDKIKKRERGRKKRERKTK